MIKLTMGCVLLMLASAAQAADKSAPWRLVDSTAESPFKTKISAENGRWVVSDSVIVEMPDVDAALSVKHGEISVNGDEFSAAPRRIKPFDRVRVRLVTNSEWKQLSTATISVDKISAQFSVLLADSSPDPFTFTAQTEVMRSSIIYSNTVTITGIDMATPISITGGYYRIDGGAWTQAAGTINLNQTLQLYVMSSASYSATTTATVTVGDYSPGFSVTTDAYSTGGGGGGYDSGGGYGSGGSVGAMLALFSVVGIWWRRRR